MRKMTVGLALLGVVYTAAADVVTNTWITPSGGKWLATNEVGVLVNWAGNLTDTNAVMNTVADFALDDRAAICTSYDASPSAGMIFRPAGSAAADPAAWPTWYLKVEPYHADFVFSTSVRGSFPLRVENGWLVLGNEMWLAAAGALDDGPVRKEGNGAVRASRFYCYRNSGRTLDIAEGTVFPMSEAALAYMDVRVTDPAGALVFTNCTPRAFLGSFAPQPGVPQPLNGVDLRMGALAATTVPGEVCGTGRVTAVARSVYVTNVAPHVVYGASAGRLRLDTTDSAAVPFVHYDFETSLTADASGNGRDLTAEGDVARVYDDERGGHVARFTATAKTGGRLSVSVPHADELTGDADYTISLWAKAASPCANDRPTFFSIGQMPRDRSLVQFRFMDADCTNLLLGHWNGRGDFTNIAPTRDAAAWNSAAWHHYVAMREGGFCAVWVDGRKVFERRETGLVMTLPRTVQITLGALVGFEDRFFHGDLDDVRVYAHALGTDGVARLFAGLEPVQDGAAPTRGAPPDLPEGTRLALDLNGAIQLAGAQTLAATNVTATGPRGTLDLPAGGTLTLTGPGVYPAGVSGTGRLVKDGPGRLVLGGALAQTGGTEVKAGTLVLENDATQVARVGVWDFACGLGVEAGGSGRDLTTQADVARVWDDERGGYVAEFPGTPGQRLEATLDSSMLAGDSDYTLSVWAKPAADCPAEGTLLSLGQQSDFREVVFRFDKGIASGTMVLSHWGGALDFKNLTTPAATQGVWRHYAAVREGSRFTVYVDGVATWTETRAGALGLAAVKPLCLGRQVDRTDRPFKGRLADVAVWGRALGASEIARLFRRETPRAVARGARVDALAGVPAPVLHYAFEDASQVGFDSAPGAHHLEKAGAGAFTLVDSPLGGKALQFDAYNHAYLMCAAPPGVLPDDGRPFTVSLWVQTAAADARTWLADAGFHSPTFVSWGDPAKKTIDVMLSYWHDESVPHGFATPRCYVGGVNGAVDKNGDAVLPCLREAAPARRWHHYAVVYDPKNGIRNYIDGVYLPAFSQDGAFATRAASAGNVFYLGAKTTAPDATFRGALDEVKVYAAALDARQIRAVMRADAGALRVLPEGGDVAVAAGAALEVNGTDETVGALTGQGAVNLLSGALTLTNAVSAFEGTLAGDGTLRLAAGAAWTLARAPTAFTGYVELAGGALTLPEGVEAIPATFRVTPLDTARETVCAGDVEIPDGTALALTAAYRGPFATARGRVIVAGGGSVTLPAPAAVGTWVIAQGAEDVRDDGAGALADRWRVTNLPATRTARFHVAGGAFLCTVPPSGTLLLVR